MPHAAAPGPRLSPAAYSQWIGACEAVGWHGTTVAELVPVRDGLGRVTPTTVCAGWPVPRLACAAMDGIAIKADPVAAPFTTGR